jgi:hypothetical protein
MRHETRMRLTKAALAMLRESGHDERDGCGFGVELHGAGRWAVARGLQALGMGWVEGGQPNGSSLPGLFFANAEGVQWVAEDSEA